MKIIAENLAQLIYEGKKPCFLVFGLPFPVGQIKEISRLVLVQQDQILPLQAQATGWWPDGSIRWCLCKTVISKSGYINALMKAEEPGKELYSEEGNNGTNTVCIHSKSDASSNVAENVLFSLFKQALVVSLGLKLNGCSEPLVLQGKTVSMKEDALSQTHIIQGVFKHRTRVLKICCTVEVCKKTAEIRVQLRLHNPNAAVHKGGHWDLGDAASAMIEAFSLSLQAPNSQLSLILNDAGVEHAKPTFHQGHFSLGQYSSGGQHWKSPVHWDANRNSTVQEQGFRLQNEGEVLATGMRAEPVAYLQTDISIVGVMLEDFWQNFPVGLEGDQQGLCWQLFPQLTELQGGESKTWRFYARMQPSSSQHVPEPDFSLNTKVKVCYNPNYLNTCQILPYLVFSPQYSQISGLIEEGLSGEYSFFSKRERVDEYGWRHYGDLYADHETHGLPKQAYFISHYNNQYDPLMGMILQYLRSGECVWLDLVHPLGRHIQDIDIYDTQQDKVEYNGGLFWHTDHYLSAETCSHRSNSRYHQADYEGFLGSGGPGGQHCYTTGLTLLYWLFGDEEAKQKVKQLCDWIRCFYNGSGLSIAERTFRLFTVDLKSSGLTNIGVKVPGYRYPLDRGIGNYLVALLDHYDLFNRPELKQEMAQVIRQTCHPKDDIRLRALDNIEGTWHYTVFLQAVVRYLFLKESENNIDQDYWYARHSFLHYCQWMYAHEGFYLDTPEKLTFPNDTWCAQELRKANLFCFAYYFSEHHESHYLERASEYYTYVANRLEHSQEAHYTRVLALMMQNDGVSQKFVSKPRSKVAYQKAEYDAAPCYNLTRIILNYFRDTVKILFNFSIQQEWRWLKIRFSRLFLDRNWLNGNE